MLQGEAQRMSQRLTSTRLQELFHLLVVEKCITFAANSRGKISRDRPRQSGIGSRRKGVLVRAETAIDLGSHDSASHHQPWEVAATDLEEHSVSVSSQRGHRNRESTYRLGDETDGESEFSSCTSTEEVQPTTSEASGGDLLQKIATTAFMHVSVSHLRRVSGPVYHPLLPRGSATSDVCGTGTSQAADSGHYTSSNGPALMSPAQGPEDTCHQPLAIQGPGNLDSRSVSHDPVSGTLSGAMSQFKRTEVPNKPSRKRDRSVYAEGSPDVANKRKKDGLVRY